MSIDEEGASEHVSSRLRKIDRKMNEADQFWDELQRAERDPHYQAKPPQILERVPSERRRERSIRKSKGKPSAEAEERRRRADPFGIASRHRAKPSQDGQSIESPKRKQPSIREVDR